MLGWCKTCWGGGARMKLGGCAPPQKIRQWSVSVPGPSHQNMLWFGTFVKKPTKSGLSHAVLYHIGMQAIYNCHNPFDEVVESEVFKMSITPELARFAKVDNPSELDINLVKSEVRSLISMSAVGDSYFQTH